MRTINCRACSLPGRADKLNRAAPLSDCLFVASNFLQCVTIKGYIKVSLACLSKKVEIIFVVFVVRFLIDFSRLGRSQRNIEFSFNRDTAH